jgi:hypothetical protein
MKCIVALLLLASWPAHGEISSYQLSQQSCARGALYTTRKYIENGVEKYLVVDTATLKTRSIEARRLTDCVHQPLGPGQNQTQFFKAVNEYNSNPGDNGNCSQGFKAFPQNCMGAQAPMIMTSDLCPSRKTLQEWQRDVKPFLQRMAALNRGGRKTNIVLPVTGAWLRSHQAELAEIKSLGLDITWANHSTSHGIAPLGPFAANPASAFLTQKTEREFVAEIFNTEKEMLANGLMPSPFFRFPGLMGTKAQIYKLREMGLIPLATTAWLALDRHTPAFYKRCGMNDDQAAAAGKVILTHSNGNEPAGITKANRLIAQMRDNSNFIPIEEAVKCDLNNRRNFPSVPVVSQVR